MPDFDINQTFFIDFLIDTFNFAKGEVPVFIEGIIPYTPLVKGFLSFLSLLFIAGIVFSMVRIWEIRKEEEEELHFAEPTDKAVTHEREEWDVVEKHINSEHPSDWRVAIIEADNILEDIITQIGYSGETLADRLKQVEKSDIRSIQSAWEAHKVRNKIAHEGSAFNLDHRTARQTIEQYRQVFEELGYL